MTNENRIAVRYHSRTGNTKKIADAIAAELGVEAKDLSSPLEDKAEILFLGSAIYAAGVDKKVKSFIADNKDKIGTIFSFCTTGMLTSTYKQIKKLAEDCGVNVAEAEFHCRGKFLLLHGGRPNEEDIAAARAFAKDAIKSVDVDEA